MLARILYAVIPATFIWSSAALTAFADPIQYLDQTRYTSTTAFVKDAFGSVTDTDEALAPDFADFSHLAEADALLPSGFSTANALHESSLGPDSIIAIGAASAGTAIDTIADVISFAEAATVLDVYFRVEETTVGGVFSRVSTSVVGGGGAEVAVWLVGPNGTVFAEFFSDVNDGRERFELISFDPGEYRLAVAATADSVGTGASYGSFQVGVVIPEPATVVLMLGALFIVPSSRRRTTKS